MTGKRIFPLVAIIIMTGLACIFLLSKVSKVGVDVKNSNHVGSRCEELAAYDIGLYVIGEVPRGLTDLGDKLHVVPADQISSSNMPVYVPDIHSSMTDARGNLIRENVPREYPSHMLIMVNVTEENPLSGEDLAIIRDCAVDNEVPVLLVGQYSINTFREYLLAPSKVVDVNDTMLFISPNTWTLNPFEGDDDAGSLQFTASFIDFWFARITDTNGN